MSKKIRTEAVDYLFDAILSLQDKEECYTFFEDICTGNLAQRISNRLWIFSKCRMLCTFPLLFLCICRTICCQYISVISQQTDAQHHTSNALVSSLFLSHRKPRTFVLFLSLISHHMVTFPSLFCSLFSSSGFSGIRISTVVPTPSSLMIRIEPFSLYRSLILSYTL